MTGKYKILQDDTTNHITVFKNNQKLQELGINLSQCNIINGDQPAISPDGHYIGFICEDSGLASDRVVVFQGS